MEPKKPQGKKLYSFRACSTTRSWFLTTTSRARARARPSSRVSWIFLTLSRTWPLGDWPVADAVVVGDGDGHGARSAEQTPEAGAPAGRGPRTPEPRRGVACECALRLEGTTCLSRRGSAGLREPEGIRSSGSRQLGAASYWNRQAGGSGAWCFSDLTIPRCRSASASVRELTNRPAHVRLPATGQGTSSSRSLSSSTAQQSPRLQLQISENYRCSAGP